MAEYIDRNKIPWAKVDNPKGIFWERVVFESAINNIPPADVIERTEVDKAIAEIEQVKSVMTEEIMEHDREDLINFVNGINQCLIILKEI